MRSCTTTPSTDGAGCWSSTKPIAGRRSSGTRSRPSSINRVGRAGSRPSLFWAIRSWFAHLATRDFGGFAPDVGAHLHLPPLDLDEARELLAFTGHDHDQADRVLEELHRDARGNPSGLLRLARRSAGTRADPASAIGSDRDIACRRSVWSAPRAAGRSQAKDPGEREDTEHSSQPAPLLGVATAHMVECSIGDAVVDSHETSDPRRRGTGRGRMGRRSGNGTRGDRRRHRLHPNACPPDDSSFNEELIEDRYAALQAWTEWTESQEKAASRGVAIESSHRDARGRAAADSIASTASTDGAAGSLEPLTGDARRRAFGPSLNMSSRRTASSSRGSVNQNSHDPTARMIGLASDPRPSSRPTLRESRQPLRKEAQMKNHGDRLMKNAMVRRKVSYGLSSAMFDGRGSLTISLTSRCRRRRSWCSRPFPFPGGTATTVGLARTISCRFETEPSVGGTCFISSLPLHLTLASHRFRTASPRSGSETSDPAWRSRLGGDILGIASARSARCFAPEAA